ncbi:4Fe-4S binding protein [Bacillus sp. EB01]|uniref:4Fe-4S binding protein n=1 Tax=Bacillus sp. EB01 TaxID=1347086 RepID=UPI0005C6253A|nr:4Fe-4S binding protein [Bacillus sp. EB01]
MGMLITWLESLAYEINITAGCLHSLSRKSTCNKCIDGCPVEAIALSNGKPAINEELCTKCGACIPVCPPTAIHGRSPERTVYNNVLLINEESFPGVEELLYFYKKGIRTLSYKDNTQQSLKVVNRLLTEMGVPAFKIIDQTNCKDNEQGYSRRGFFQKAVHEGRKLAATTITPAKWRFNQDVFNIPGMFDETSLYNAVIDSSTCTVCEACFKLCPKHVFSIDNEVIIINQKDCTGCSLCADVCTHDSITVSLKAHKELTSRMEIRIKACSHCCNAFYSWPNESNELCEHCRNRRQNGYLSPYGN